MNNRKILISIVLLFTTLSLFAQKETYEKGWDAFLNNDRAQARELFTVATNNEVTKADALLSLSLLDWSEEKLEDAFVKLENFYKTSANPGAYLYGSYVLPFSFGRGVLEKNKLAFLESIVNTEQNGTLKAMINGSLGEHYMSSNNFEKAKQMFARTGALSNWQILGRFENISGSGFNKDWGVVENSSPSSVFKNKEKVDVQWHSPGLNKENGWFAYLYYFYSGNSIYYSQNIVNSPVEQEVYLRIGVSGSLKAWVNDALVMSEEKELNCDLDIYATKVKLNKGANRILLQLGESEINSANFMLRITDAEANPIQGLEHKAAISEYTKSTEKTNTTLLPFFAEEYLKNAIAKEPSNMLNYAILAEVYLRNDKADQAVELLEGMEEKAPKSSFIQSRLSEGYIRSNNQTYSTKALENIKTNDPESFYALYDLVSEAISSKKISEVKSLRDKIQKLYGESVKLNDIDLNLASLQNNEEEIASIIKTNYAKYPYKYGYMRAFSYLEEYKFKRSKVATKIIEDYCAKYFDATALEDLSKRYIQSGNTKKGLQVLVDRIAKLPYAHGYLQSYAKTLFDMQQYPEALVITDNVLKLSPYTARIYALRGDIYKAQKNDKLAIENYRKAVHYAPADFESRKQLHLLGDMKEMEDYFPKNNLDSLISNAPGQVDYPDDHSVILLYDNQILYHKEGAYETHNQIAVKILNQTGIEVWKEYYVPSQGLTLDKAEVIKVDGQKVKAETSGNQIVFTALEVGDVLHLDYRTKLYTSGILSKYFSDYLILRLGVPIVQGGYSILMPKDEKIDFLVKNGEVEPNISEKDDMKMYSWAINNQPAIRDEPMMLSYTNISPTLLISSIPKWEVISEWYKDVTTNKIQSDYLLKKTLAEILKGNENASQLEKAELFYNYILKNITYSNVPFMQNNFIPQKASRTISTRLGDCKDVSTLFVTLCREVGIEANLVLVLTRDNGDAVLALPDNNFNHCIAQFKNEGKIYYLELTDNKLPFGAILDNDLRAAVLPIPFGDEKMGDKILKMDMPFRKSNEINRLTTFTFNNNDVYTSTKSIFKGSFASYIRHYYADLGSEEQIKNMTQAISSDYTTSVKVNKLVFDDLNSLADSAVYLLDLEAKNIVQEVADMKIFKLKWNDNLGSLDVLSLEQRKFPFVLWAYLYGNKYKEEISIILPENKKLVEIPKDVSLESVNISYTLTYNTSEKGIIKITRTLVPKTEFVSIKEYEEFRDLMHLVNEYDNKQYVIK